MELTEAQRKKLAKENAANEREEWLAMRRQSLLDMAVRLAPLVLERDFEATDQDIAIRSCDLAESIIKEYVRRCAGVRHCDRNGVIR